MTRKIVPIIILIAIAVSLVVAVIVMFSVHAHGKSSQSYYMKDGLVYKNFEIISIVNTNSGELNKELKAWNKTARESNWWVIEVWTPEAGWVIIMYTEKEPVPFEPLKKQ